MRHFPPTRAQPRPVLRLISRLLRITDKSYAEVQVISHPGSHHKEGDVILIDLEEYKRGVVVDPKAPPTGRNREETRNLSKVIEDFLATNPGANLPFNHQSAEENPKAKAKGKQSQKQKPTPTRSKTNDHPRRKSKNQSKKAAR